MKFERITLGQSIMRYEVPLDIFTTINSIYETKFLQLPAANKALAGKIKNEHTIFHDGNDKLQKKNSFIPQNVFEWFISIFKHYLIYNNYQNSNLHLNSIWINEMKDNEYNPIHRHYGSLETGLSSVMILKLPTHFGNEYSAEHLPMNGKLQIIGSTSGQFAKMEYTPPMFLRDFYVFPYDMRHCVYPFNDTNQVRRTLAANCDVMLEKI